MAEEQITLDEAKKEIGPLRQQLIQWGKEYYEQDNPSVEDYVYDRQYQRLVELEARFPELVTPDSVSYTHLTLPTTPYV